MGVDSLEVDVLVCFGSRRYWNRRFGDKRDSPNPLI